MQKRIVLIIDCSPTGEVKAYTAKETSDIDRMLDKRKLNPVTLPPNMRGSLRNILAIWGVIPMKPGGRHRQ